jgi:hypothetical protein
VICLSVRTPTKGKDIRDQIPEIRDKKFFARRGRFTPIIALQFFRKVVSSPGGTTDLQAANSFGDKSDLFVGEDTDEGEVSTYPKVGVCTNRLEKKNKLFVGEDTNKGEK